MGLELQTRQGADAEARVALLERELADHVTAHGGVKLPSLDKESIPMDH
jgi:hypothetical protein